MKQNSANAAGVGVLLANLGTPDAPTPTAIRRYLRQFLSDRRVVELPRALWLPVLYGFILPFRPRRLAHAYAQVWQAEGSPLLVISRQQQAALSLALQNRLGRPLPVALAMTYGEPSIASALAELDAAGVERILLLPLYPQYSGTTTAAVLDGVFSRLSARRLLPALHTISDYHDDPGYIAALAASVHAHWQSQGRGAHLLMSFHSIPQRYVDAGDPYQRQCQATAQLLARALQLDETQWSLSYQSRIGNQPWLSPYTDLYITELAQRGYSTLDVICPGFSADCLETLEEVSLRYGETFRAAGGNALRYIPALNADEAHIDALAQLVLRQLRGWLD